MVEGWISGGRFGPAEKRCATRVGMHACNATAKLMVMSVGRHDTLSVELRKVVGEGHKWWLLGRWDKQRVCGRCLAGRGWRFCLTCLTRGADARARA